jgi:hypothetical protein
LTTPEDVLTLATRRQAPLQYTAAVIEEAKMPRVVITHDVVDLDRWLEGKAERQAAISAIGANVIDTVALHGSNKIAVTFETNDLAAVQAMLASPPPEVGALMEKHGVIPPFTAFVEK